MTQKERVLDALQKNLFVRDKFIIEGLHIYQYNSVIHALRKDGHDIRSTIRKVPNPVNPCILIETYGYCLYKDGIPYVKGGQYVPKV